MNESIIDVLIPGVLGLVSLLGVGLLAVLGKPDSQTLNSAAGLFTTWAVGAGIYHGIHRNTP